MLALATTVEESARGAGRAYDFDAYQLKLDHKSMLSSIEKLASAVAHRAGVPQGS